MYKIEKNGYFFTVTDTVTGFQEINEARNLVKWMRNDGGSYVFLLNVPVTEDVKTMFVLGVTAKEFAMHEIVDKNNVAFVSVAIFELFLNTNIGFLSSNENPAIVRNTDGTVINYVNGGDTFITDGVGTVENSNLTFTAPVACGGVLELPNETWNVYVNGVFNVSFVLPPLDPANEINITA